MTFLTCRFSATCRLDVDGDVTCNNCPEGYEGRHCETCASGYSGNPVFPVDPVCPALWILYLLDQTVLVIHVVHSLTVDVMQEQDSVSAW